MLVMPMSGGLLPGPGPGARRAVPSKVLGRTGRMSASFRPCGLQPWLHQVSLTDRAQARD